MKNTCMTCLTHEEDENGCCKNHHDNWFDEMDYETIEYIMEQANKLGITIEDLMKIAK